MKNKIPTILTGDFNSTPNSCIYSGITTGKIKEYEFDINPKIQKIEPIIMMPKIFAKNIFISTYHFITQKEPIYTNYTSDYKDTLDYIFVNNKVKIIGVLKEINIDHKLRIPDEEYPSDHLLQMAIIKI